MTALVAVRNPISNLRSTVIRTVCFPSRLSRYCLGKMLRVSLARAHLGELDRSGSLSSPRQTWVFLAFPSETTAAHQSSCTWLVLRVYYPLDDM